MKICRSLVTFVVTAGCAAPQQAMFPDDRLTQRHATRPAAFQQDPAPQLERPAMVRFHMERHFDDLRTVERLLVAGRLAEATTQAHLLTRSARDPGLAMWKDESERVAAAASAVEHASTLDQALQRETMIAAACVACHERTHSHPTFATDPAPPDRPSREARMARHQWAVDRLWEGLIGADDLRWTAGLEILSAAPLPDVRPRDAAQLQQLARRALTEPSSSSGDRVIVYREMLATCIACHAGRRSRH